MFILSVFRDFQLSCLMAFPLFPYFPPERAWTGWPDHVGRLFGRLFSIGTGVTFFEFIRSLTRMHLSHFCFQQMTCQSWVFSPLPYSLLLYILKEPKKPHTHREFCSISLAASQILSSYDCLLILLIVLVSFLVLYVITG